MRIKNEPFAPRRKVNWEFAGFWGFYGTIASLLIFWWARALLK